MPEPLPSPPASPRGTPGWARPGSDAPRDCALPLVQAADEANDLRLRIIKKGSVATPPPPNPTPEGPDPTFPPNFPVSPRIPAICPTTASALAGRSAWSIRAVLHGPRRGAGGSPCRPSSASPASQQRARQAVGPAGRGPSEGGGCAGGPSATAMRRNPPGIPSSCQNQRVRTNPRARRSPSLVRPVAESGQRGRGGGALGSRHGPPQASRRPVGPPAPPAGLAAGAGRSAGSQDPRPATAPRPPPWSRSPGPRPSPRRGPGSDVLGDASISGDTRCRRRTRCRALRVRGLRFGGGPRTPSRCRRNRASLAGWLRNEQTGASTRPSAGRGTQRAAARSLERRAWPESGAGADPGRPTRHGLGRPVLSGRGIGSKGRPAQRLLASRGPGSGCGPRGRGRGGAGGGSGGPGRMGSTRTTWPCPTAPCSASKPPTSWSVSARAAPPGPPPPPSSPSPTVCPPHRLISCLTIPSPDLVRRLIPSPDLRHESCLASGSGIRHIIKPHTAPNLRPQGHAKRSRLCSGRRLASPNPISCSRAAQALLPPSSSSSSLSSSSPPSPPGRGQETVRQFEFLSIKRRTERARHNFECHCDDLLRAEEAARAEGRDPEEDEGAGDKVGEPRGPRGEGQNRYRSRVPGCQRHAVRNIENKWRWTEQAPGTTGASAGDEPCEPGLRPPLRNLIPPGDSPLGRRRPGRPSPGPSRPGGP